MALLPVLSPAYPTDGYNRSLVKLPKTEAQATPGLQQELSPLLTAQVGMFKNLFSAPAKRQVRA